MSFKLTRGFAAASADDVALAELQALTRTYYDPRKFADTYALHEYPSPGITGGKWETFYNSDNSGGQWNQVLERFQTPAIDLRQIGSRARLPDGYGSTLAGNTAFGRSVVAYLIDATYTPLLDRVGVEASVIPSNNNFGSPPSTAIHLFCKANASNGTGVVLGIYNNQFRVFGLYDDDNDGTPNAITHGTIGHTFSRTAYTRVGMFVVGNTVEVKINGVVAGTVNTTGAAGLAGGLVGFGIGKDVNAYHSSDLAWPIVAGLRDFTVTRFG
ncbi:MAG TPA: hypothetical protein VGN72_04310 [Tepidisphaeraceae bacterium]|jgi:hypothetical protein|nr:hypothetical protein [Tepidisphaeraceae bacterium]